MIMRNKLKWLSALAGTAVIAAACATTGVEVPVSIDMKRLASEMRAVIPLHTPSAQFQQKYEEV